MANPATAPISIVTIYRDILIIGPLGQ